GKGLVEFSTDQNQVNKITVANEKDSYYLIYINNSKRSGRRNNNNKCAIRSFSVDNQYAGVLVFPQRGKDEWSEWGFSNRIKVALKKGSHQFKIHFEDWNNNMDVQVNTAMLDYLRIIEKSEEQ
ncbi:MAG: glycogen debranching protein, partial [Bacteroidota bacterium]